jgi:uncharacterized protein DUF3180
VRRTGPGDLAVPFFLVAVTAYVLLRFSYDSLPPLHYIVAAPLLALAVGEFVAARRVRAAVRHDPHARPMAALVIARCVALGKASSLVSAGVAGAAVALLVRVAPHAGSIRAAADDTRVSAVLLGAALTLLAAGLLLERAGIDPGSRNGRDERGAPA